MESNDDIDTTASSSCMTKNKDKDEHIITGISDVELNDYYDMATNDNTISEQLRRMFYSNDDVIIVYIVYIYSKNVSILVSKFLKSR